MSQDIKLTTNGVASQIYNGIPDWVYEEEVFEDNSALWWSPDATKLVYGSFDDSDVDIYFLAEYGSWKRIDQYPFWAEVRYPKVRLLSLLLLNPDLMSNPKIFQANMTNPKNSLWMVNLVDQSEPKQVLPPTSLANEGETHFSWVTWADRGKKFAVTWMNRVQNKTVIALCSVNDLDCSSNNKHIFTRVMSFSRHICNQYQLSYLFLGGTQWMDTVQVQNHIQSSSAESKNVRFCHDPASSFS